MREYARVSIGIAAFCICCMACVEKQPTDGAGVVVAVVGDHAITHGEFEEVWRARVPTEYVRTRHEEYELRRRALDAIIAERLVNAEADRLGVPVAVLLERALDEVPSVTEMDIAAAYEESNAAAHGVALDEVRTMIEEHLIQRQVEEAQRKYVEALRRAGNVRVVLEPPREVVPVVAEDPSKGDSEAPVQIIEFSDFQCPFCAEAWPTFEQLYREYREYIKWTWKDFPSLTHEMGHLAAEAAQCAHEQGAFWAYHDRVFSHQTELQRDTIKGLEDVAVALSIDIDMFTKCLESEGMADRVAGDVASGRQVGVSATPTLFINGRMVAGARSYGTYERMVLEELKAAGIEIR